MSLFQKLERGIPLPKIAVLNSIFCIKPPFCDCSPNENLFYRHPHIFVIFSR
ncbi:hypothetical protein LEP1GSC187_2875 [Leptospira santarosai str. ZUN179]|uniref:Uncharacterized protein n=1 Tax=Leptospira santarosai str. ZUN179 TaxID=1049985 RepID=M6ULH6_9LEPT|nr:hypothetical protein LEP1GSC187_2875 [Leptospira santarosai str. ZUN179]